MMWLEPLDFSHWRKHKKRSKSMGIGGFLGILLTFGVMVWFGMQAADVSTAFSQFSYVYLVSAVLVVLLGIAGIRTYRQRFIAQRQQQGESANQISVADGQLVRSCSESGKVIKQVPLSDIRSAELVEAFYEGHELIGVKILLRYGRTDYVGLSDQVDPDQVLASLTSKK